jgi:hypothetical protein
MIPEQPDMLAGKFPVLRVNVSFCNNQDGSVVTMKGVQESFSDDTRSSISIVLLLMHTLSS